MNNTYTIRRFCPEDAEAVVAMIARNMREVNSKDYSEEFIEEEVRILNKEWLLSRSQWTHAYVVCDGGKVIGHGAIGPYWGSETESSLFTIFVLPAYHGQGVGRAIIETLEQDEYFLRANRVEVPASVTAREFYRKMG
ncbi:MAG: GNAT family N-acetyltransferase, partial [Clostridia bacterium]|nr:GNAT family N-acetyltransferase [Clostridia bacterium]